MILYFWRISKEDVCLAAFLYNCYLKSSLQLFNVSKVRNENYSEMLRQSRRNDLPTILNVSDKREKLVMFQVFDWFSRRSCSGIAFCSHVCFSNRLFQWSPKSPPLLSPPSSVMARPIHVRLAFPLLRTLHLCDDTHGVQRTITYTKFTTRGLICKVHVSMAPTAAAFSVSLLLADWRFKKPL